MMPRGDETISGPRQLEFADLKQETAFGTAIAGTGQTAIPWESYAVEQTQAVEVRAKMTGFIDNVNVDGAGLDVAGSAEAEIHPDNATFLMKTLTGIPRVTFNGNPQDVPTFTHRFYDVAQANYFRHVSLKCNGVTFACAGPNGELKATYDFMAQLEEPVASFSQPSLPDQASFQMRHAWASGASLIKVADIAEPNCENFEVAVTNGLRLGERRNDSGYRVAIDPGTRESTVTMGLRGDKGTWAVDYDGLLRGQNTGTKLRFEFNYPGTGSPVDTVVIECIRAVIATCPRQGGPKDVATKNTTWTCKRSPSQDDVLITIT